MAAILENGVGEKFVLIWNFNFSFYNHKNLLLDTKIPKIGSRKAVLCLKHMKCGSRYPPSWKMAAILNFHVARVLFEKSDS